MDPYVPSWLKMGSDGLQEVPMDPHCVKWVLISTNGSSSGLMDPSRRAESLRFLQSQLVLNGKQLLQIRLKLFWMHSFAPRWILIDPMD